MVTKYRTEIDNKLIIRNIERVTDKIFKLLPSREEGVEWRVPLNNIILELHGMSNLFEDRLDFFRVLCKLEGLLTLTEEDDFLLFRRTIFECLELLSEVKQCLH